VKEITLGKACILKSGKFISASEIQEQPDEGLYPCYGGNGIRGYVSEYSHDGHFPLIGRQGALCGNVNYASGKFRATEHAVVVQPVEEIDTRWLYYKLIAMNLGQYATGAAQPGLAVNKLEQLPICIPSLAEQKQTAKAFDKIEALIALRKEQLAKLDQLVKARFIELFGDPISNSMKLPTERMELRFNLKAGITTAADNIHDFEEGKFEVPCYGGNGIRGYVEEKSYSGNYPIIGRQGALCGNVQYATGEFHATEHAVLVSLLKDDNTVWVYHLLKLMDLFRFHTGAAQPGLAVKTLNTIDVIVADRELQNQFAAFVEQTNKTKLTIQASLDKLEVMKKALMQEYFG
jgi:type I restriction enzyme S subunit